MRLFAALAESFVVLHGRKYSRVNKWRNSRSSGRMTLPGGPALRWTSALFDIAAERAAGTPYEEALRILAKKSSSGNRDRLAERIGQTAPSAKKRMHSYRWAGRTVKNPKI
jgi:hypothetical protein